MLTNKQLVNFCIEMLGTSYWFGVSTAKATKTVYKTGAYKYPLEYSKENEDYYLKAIEDKEIVSDMLGLIKGFAWTNGGEEIIASKYTDTLTYPRPNEVCPDKSINGLFSWAIDQQANWGGIEGMPEMPGIILTDNGKIAVYEGEGKIIEFSTSLKRCVRSKINPEKFKYWYELPFIVYEKTEEEKAIITIAEEKVRSGIAKTNVLFRDESNEDAKFLGIIKQGSNVNILQETNKWIKIQSEGITGYALKDYFLKLKNVLSKNVLELPAEYYIEPKTAVASDILTLRSLPSPKSGSNINLTKGTEIQIIGISSKGWPLSLYEDDTKSILGYANPRRIKIQEKEEDIKNEENGIF